MARTLRYLIVFLLVCSGFSAYAQSSPGEITGHVYDPKGAPVPGAIVQAFVGGISKGGAQADEDGAYHIKPIDPGTYDVTVKSLEYGSYTSTGVQVSQGKATGVNLKFAETNTKVLKEFVVKWHPPVVDTNSPGQHNVYGSKDIEHNAARSTEAIVGLSAGTYQQTAGGAVSFQGGRTYGTVYIIDGMVVSNPGNVGVAQGGTDQIDVIPSGLPANYGDVSGGVVNIVTKGASKDYRGSILAQHSIDGYNNNLFNFTLSGPLFTRKDSLGNKRPLLGFFIGGDYYYNKDGGPNYNGYYTTNTTLQNQLNQNPLTVSSDATGQHIYKYASEFVTADQFVHHKANPNGLSQDLRLNGRLDFNVAPNMDITAGGSFNYSSSKGISGGALLFAPEATPNSIGYTGRGFIRFRQKFGKPAAPGEKPGLISNAFYTVQADYQVDYSSSQDANFKHNIFEYEYVGKFTPTTVPFYALSTDSISQRLGIVYFGNQTTSVNYQRSNLNPILANYTSEVYNTLGYTPFSTDQLRNDRGLLNGDLPNGTYGLFPNVGASLTGYSYSQSQQYGITADASFDMLVGKNRHQIQFGLYYQQRIYRGYSASQSQGSTISLWQIMRGLTNSHISLDKQNPIFLINGVQYHYTDVKSGLVNPSPADTILYNYAAGPNQSTFDANLRRKLGLPVNGTNIINIDALDPSTFSLSMFSADELLNSGNPFVGYQGYTYTGDIQRGQVNFNDFFTKKDANNQYTRPIGAFMPNYTAGYIMDKFNIKRLAVNFGIRVERYDAANKVLIDPYSLYAEHSVGDGGDAQNYLNKGTPSNISSNYIPYVADNNTTAPQIVGYRNGDNWYDAYGKLIEDPAILKAYTGGRDPQPYLVTSASGNTRTYAKITDSTFDPTKSFKDYTPAINVLPRLNFAFPVADKANFYGHYDIYALRPGQGYSLTTPYDYYYLNQNSNTIINNPNLKPEKTFDYEMGFQQQLSNSSGLTITGFYRERKDMIQVRPYLDAFPTTYYTYGNRDFSSTKGMTLTYTLQKINHLSMQISYTLQFAEGTGTSALSTNSGSGGQVSSSGILQSFISAGLPNMRYVYTLGTDSRHNLSASIDYRYEDNEGPTVGGSHIFQNAGVNLTARARSGEPWTRYATPVGSDIIGEVNGARLPWHYGLDLAVDKNFLLSFRKKPVDEAATAKVKQSRKYYINAFVRVTNLLNVKDILAVYRYTGSASDNGYLSSSYGQQAIPNQTSPKAYVDQYTLDIQTIGNGNYNLPRMMNIGVNFNF